MSSLLDDLRKPHNRPKPEVKEKIFEYDGSTFGAFYNACEWLTKNGYSYGSGCITGPIGIIRGDAYISKYRHLSLNDRQSMDGWLHHERDKDAKVIFNY